MISSVPLCAAASCNDEYAELVLNAFFRDTFSNPVLPCQHVTMTIDGAGGPSSKPTKGEKVKICLGILVVFQLNAVAVI